MEFAIIGAVAFVVGAIAGVLIGRNSPKHVERAIEDVTDYYEHLVEQLEAERDALKAKLSRKKTS